MQDQALREQKLRLLEAVLAAAAHDLNGHAQAVQLIAQVLRDTCSDLQRVADRFLVEHGDFQAGGFPYTAARDELPAHFNDLLEVAGQARRLAEGLATVSKPLEAARVELFQLNPLVERAAVLLGHAIRSAGVRLELRLGSNLPPVAGCPQLLQLALMRLILDLVGGRPVVRRRLVIATRCRPPAREVICELSGGEDCATGEGLDLAGRAVAGHGGTLEVGTGPGPQPLITLRLPVPGGEA